MRKFENSDDDADIAGVWLINRGTHNVIRPTLTLGLNQFINEDLFAENSGLI